VVIDKRMSTSEVVGELRSGMRIGIGGWGARRKPMAIVREILRSDLRDLTLVGYGGPEVGLLCAAGKVRKLISGFVSLDSIPIDPHYRRLRESGTLDNFELDEAVMMLGLMAAAWRVPFLPTRAGLGSDLLSITDELRTVTSPYDDGEVLLAAPALTLDVSLVHVNRADAAGNAQVLGTDPYFDPLFARAAERTFVSCEKIVQTDELSNVPGSFRTIAISRLFTDGVVETPRGAHFTACAPDYARDEAFQRKYADAAKDPDRWSDFSRDYLELDDEAAYQAAVQSV
jgi:glutaconate CoA-transferase subunit A